MALPVQELENRHNWLAQRKTGIGGSDAAAVLGLSKWATPYQVWLDKTSPEVASMVDNEAMKWGRTLEPVIRQEYSERTGRPVYQPAESIIRHPEHPFVVASLDGYTEDHRIVEIKTSKRQNDWGEEGSDEIPQEYLLQVQHYMAVTGFEIADVAVLIAGSDFRLYTVAADVELHSLMFEAYGVFWQQVVQANPPEPISEADLQHYFKAKRKDITATPEIETAINQLKQVNCSLKALETEAEEIKKAIMFHMGEHDTLLHATTQKPLATWKAAKAPIRFDAKQLEKEQPDLYQKYLVESRASRRFLLK